LAVIDLHCHLLPGIDDGPATEDGALAMARAAVAQGTTAVVATPHVSWDYANSAARIEQATELLRGVLVRERIPLELHTGAEIAMPRAAEMPDEELVALRLGGPGATHLLVECPFTPSVSGFDNLLSRLRSRGHEIVLAHPERCPAFQRDPAAYARLVHEGALGQITASSLVGRFGRPVREFAEALLRDGLVHVVASDAHDATDRPPSIAAELDDAGFGEHAGWFARDMPRAIVDGARMPPAPPMPEPPRGPLRRLLRR
jgi:protein-tyrosine phosphatase